MVGEEPSEFGASVAIQGDTLLVGEQHWPGAIGNYIGRVRVYESDGNQWSHVQDLHGEGFAGESFGHSVAIFGDVAVIGREYTEADKVHVFRYGGVDWIPEQVLSAPEENSRFGNAVAAGDNEIVVGASSSQQPPGTGATHIYRYVNDEWVADRTLVSPGVQEFGRSVALAGTTLAVGANEAAFVYGPAEFEIDCNGNGNADDCDIANGTSGDRNENGVPDECEPCLLG